MPKAPILKRTAVLLLTLTSTAQADTWTGKVVGIADGDTLSVMHAGRAEKIRLAEIDAPEKRQAYGQRSKQALSALCFSKEATVTGQGADKYHRTIGRVECVGVDVNAEQVKTGMAWAYRKYLTDQSFIVLEESARASKLGLWADPNPIPPWEYRHGPSGAKSASVGSHTAESASPGSPSQAPKAKPVPTASGYQCGGKSKCGEMASCAEAQYYLEHCGLSRLDRDHDGVPCESICR
ncbi:thermonuclease family protein [Methylococcus mesophilus]|uniref:thermonuclease family protein n=1 Tax=Methylococcus mesophilus TaxID=2993564 RepID=UPI00224A93ED|nr:thermonuclease family protein [Methylococcus mesophilus]UZR29055.1 thermonuclease family protein [Methylococcus mesophilus]